MVSISFSNAYLNIYTLYIDEDSTHKVCKYIPTLINLLNTVRHKEQISRRDRAQLGGPNWSENLFI